MASMLVMTSFPSSVDNGTKERVVEVEDVGDDPMNDDDNIDNDCSSRGDDHHDQGNNHDEISGKTIDGYVSRSNNVIDNDNSNNGDHDDDYVMVDHTPTQQQTPPPHHHHHHHHHHVVVEERMIPTEDDQSTTTGPLMTAISTNVEGSALADVNERQNDDDDDDDDDDDLFLPAQQSTITDPNGLDKDEIMMMTTRNCVSPVIPECETSINKYVYEDNDDDDILTDLYATPRSSPIRRISLGSNNTSSVGVDNINFSTAMVTWPIPNQMDINNPSCINIPATEDGPFPGICNLGNTCYMASALQMIASIPSFINLLTMNTSQPTTSDTSLRDAFLCLMADLQNRENSDSRTAISPHALKEAMDDRTTLFTGFRQHDAHEFITTLFDLLDEDYKPEISNNNITQVAGTAEEDAIIDNTLESMDLVIDSDHDVKQSAANVDNYSETVLDQIDDCSENDNNSISRSKKQKVEESITIPTTIANIDMDAMSCSISSLPPPNVDDPSTRSSTSNCTQSYSKLDVDAIERLIHGSSSSSSSSSNDRTSTASATTDTMMRTGIIASRSVEQNYDYSQHYDDSGKLLGGRMNTNDVILTPYSNNDQIMESPLSVSSSSLLRHPSSLFQSGGNHPQPSPHSVTTMHLPRVSNKNENDNDASGATEVIVSPIDTTFTTEVRVRLTCDSCQLTRTHKETYWHLSLEIGTPTAIDDMLHSNTNDENSSSSIEDGIRRFFAPCTQELKCEKCFCETATQSTEITKLPPVLLLHLKRFMVDYSPDWSSISYSKNQSAVYLNPDLSLNNNNDTDDNSCGALSEFLASDCIITKHLALQTTGNDDVNDNLSLSTSLSPAMTNSSMYVLRSIVNHIGNSANCGHYTADAQRRVVVVGGETESKKETTTAEWYRFNDTYVSSLSAMDVIEQSKSTAYMCLYELV